MPQIIDAQNQKTRELTVTTDQHGGVLRIGGKEIVFDLADDKLNFYVSVEDEEIQDDRPNLSVPLN